MTFFLACAAVGGVVLVVQLVLGVLGLGHGAHDAPGDVSHDLAHDPSHEHPTHGSAGLNLLSVRGLAAGLAFFGLAGAAALAGGRPLGLAVGLGLASGLAAAVAVALLMRAMLRLESDGTVRIDGAVGQLGTIYISVPGNRSGAGKVHLTLQDRLVEYQAVTSDEPLAPGTPVLVVDVVDTDTVSVTRSPLPPEGA
jgi:hypothetical protein